MREIRSTACTTATRSPGYPKGEAVQQVLEELTVQGFPGCAIAIWTEEGWWSGAAGLARIEDNTRMQTCHLQYLQSITKMYLATGVLLLYEQGKIDLDAPMTRYLPQQYIRYLPAAEQITIRMLLNHTSGLPEYNSIPAYVTRLLQQPDHPFQPEDYLKYLDRKPLDFAPGSKYAYRNTNYVILALIADAVTGDHAAFLSKYIFEPLGLSHTYYRGSAGYLDYPHLVNSYWDRYSNSIVENVTVLQRNNVAALIGDDGIVATPADAVKFLKALMEYQLLSPSTLEMMKIWEKNSNGEPTYGLGLDYAMFSGHIAYGHSGGGIGAGCQLYYFPEKNIFVFIGTNLGTVTESPLHVKLEETLNQLYAVILTLL